MSTESDVALRGVHDEPIGMSLCALRAERLLVLRDRARLADGAPSTIYLIEAGRMTLWSSVMRRIAAALGVDAQQVAEFRRAIEAYGRPR